MKGKIAIIGSGIAGISAAYFLSRDYEVHLYEKDDYVGGHTHTVTVPEENGEVPIDTGFMVFNHINYPNLTKLFSRLEIETLSTEMSLSVRDMVNGFEYCGNRLETIFSQLKNLFSVPYLRMLLEVKRFHNDTQKILAKPETSQGTVEEFIIDSGYGDFFSRYYLLPFISAVWSTPPMKMLNFPIHSLITFLQNHGLLDYPRMYDWKTIKGGSKTYVERILKKIKIRVFSHCPVVRVRELPSSKKPIQVVLSNGKTKLYDKAVIAAHADQALALIEKPSPRHRKLLSQFTYQKNLTYLHTDPSPLPLIRKNWASWNVLTDFTDPERPNFSTSYYMNELQTLARPQDYFVTLNPLYPLREDRIIKKMEYDHPVFTQSAIDAQQDLPELNQPTGPLKNLFFCGSYFGYGFHEDALTSSLRMSEQILQREVTWY